MSAPDLDGKTGQRVLDAIEHYPWLELVMYACGHTINELKDWLQRGAVAGPDQPGLQWFTREFCRLDAEYAKKSFATLWDQLHSKGGGNAKPAWDWFLKRWPCENPLTVGTLLASSRVEEMSLEETFRVPNADILSALTNTGWFQVGDLEDPPEALALALSTAGFRREQRDARPAPRLTPEG